MRFEKKTMPEILSTIIKVSANICSSFDHTPISYRFVRRIEVQIVRVVVPKAQRESTPEGGNPFGDFIHVYVRAAGFAWRAVREPTRGRHH